MRAYTLKEEAVAREREAEELRLAEGAFPVLSGGGSGSGAAVRGGAGGGGRRVLSVDSHTKCIRVETYLGVSRSGEEEDAEDADAGIDPRVRPPPLEVEYVRVQRGPATRWVDLRGGGTVKYVALPGAA
jgi:hypothetical protein